MAAYVTDLKVNKKREVGTSKSHLSIETQEQKERGIE
jgi:hypothetical protein